jgi:hypothetical protein
MAIPKLWKLRVDCPITRCSEKKILMFLGDSHTGMDDDSCGEIFLFLFYSLLSMDEKP